MSISIAKINALIDQGHAVLRVVIADIKGSSPREVGAEMLITKDTQIGSIGGGALELAATQAAISGTRGVTHHPLGPALGQCCGGHVTLVTEEFKAPLPDDQPCYQRPIGTTQPDKPLSIARHASQIRNGNIGQDLKFDAGWLSEIKTDPTRQVWIWGAGHVGRAVVQVLAALPDVHIHWIDTQKSRFPQTLPENVRPLWASDIAALMAHAPKNAEHLIFTYSHALDLALCHAATTHGYKSCGVIGSRTKWKRFEKRLVALGHDAQEVQKIDCPIGDPALGKHPQAIAISIAADFLNQQDIAAIQPTEKTG